MSDILIKGMEMPKRCTGCFNSKCLLFFEHTDPNNSRHPNCPLVELPPLGELISRQDVIDALKVACEEGCNDIYTNNVRQAIFDEVLGVVDDKEILPTILEASE